ncbi:MAG: phosphoribosylformylglycinamidine synthase subunit PurL [Hymenobacteraceae bacterium]|nr:phosphoribosylformylglycinamidine synthase subunit PurL [Hymenobacteraceae bacterium]
MENRPPATATEALPTIETARKLGLLPEEFARIQVILGRQPNFTELSIFSVMWSEHCSYKNSIVWLKKLPKDSPRMLAKAGDENAGLVDLGDGLACVFKIESHNHPSAIEPYQGAATGVGGINRDIFTMGARPVAQLNSLRFGDITLAKTRRLLRGVVRGIGDYGNAFGIATVGGELFFDPCYNTNPLVNAFSAGIVKVGETVSATASGAGNPVYIVGSATGKDGIHGATFASEDISDKSTEKLPSVQVGDPFQEKLLLEATLEIIASGCVVGMQDMGAAGITCSTSEMSAKGEVGMDIGLDLVPMRQPGMLPFEILLSESQERMLIVVEKGREAEIDAICAKWDLYCARIGHVTDTRRLRYHRHGQLVADVPANDLVLGGGAPVYHRQWQEPAYFAEAKKFDLDTISLPEDYVAIGEWLLSQPNGCSRRWVARQYDSMVGTATLTTNRPADAALVRIKGTPKALALTVDCNARYVKADPETGTAIAVCEAARNIVCSGGEPVAITNCLNFGNPYNPEVYWQFVGAIRGMSRACEALGTPVTGGNVSFYNQSSDDGPVFPTPTIGMLGLLDDYRATATGLAFRAAGDQVLLVGRAHDCLASSEYLYSYCGVQNSPAPTFILEEELAVQAAVAALIRAGLVQSAHDVSDGGLWAALAESAIASDADLGFRICTDPAFRKDAYLFGESQSRVTLSIAPTDQAAVAAHLTAAHVPFTWLGEVTADGAVRIDGDDFPAISALRELHATALELLLAADE